MRHNPSVCRKELPPACGKTVISAHCRNASCRPWDQRYCRRHRLWSGSERIAWNFPQIKIINRPEHLRADDIPMNEILIYDTGQYPADFICKHIARIHCLCRKLFRVQLTFFKPIIRLTTRFSRSHAGKHVCIFKMEAPSITIQKNSSNAGLASRVWRKFVHVYFQSREPDR